MYIKLKYTASISDGYGREINELILFYCPSIF